MIIRPRILLVEDEYRLSQCLAMELQETGYDVILAHCGRSGLAAIAAQSYDLIVLDWKLPRLSGLEVCQRLRRSGDVTPVVMITAYDDQNTLAIAQEAGISAYLVKPFHLDDLMRLICRLLPQSCLGQAA